MKIKISEPASDGYYLYIISINITLPDFFSNQDQLEEYLSPAIASIQKKLMRSKNEIFEFQNSL